MERYSSRTVDELGRIALPGDVRKLLELETGNNLSLTIVGTIVILQRVESDTDTGCCHSKANDFGMITLPTEVRQTMDWKEKDKVALYLTDNLVILKSA